MMHAYRSPYPPFRPRFAVAVVRPYVGGPTEDARDLMRTIDSYAQYFPVTADALAVQHWIFEAADALGIRDQVEYVVYALRAASGAAEVGGAAASAELSAGLSSVGALTSVLPIVGAVAAVVVFLSGGDDEEKAQAARKAYQGRIQHLRVRLSLADFAAEQRSAASLARLTASSPILAQVLGAGEPAKLQKDADTADALASLYDRAENELPANQQALFESVSNLARWRGALDNYASLTQAQKDDLDSIGFGTSQPRLPYQLKGMIEAEKSKVEALAASGGADSGWSLWSVTKAALVLAAGVGAATYFLEPALFHSLTRGALATSKVVLSRAKEPLTWATHKVTGR